MDLAERTATLMKKRVDHKPVRQLSKPTKRQSTEISNLMAQLKDREVFTQEVHLKKDDPNYGRPQEGTRTAARGRKAHEHVSKEIIELCEIIWTHGQIRGYDCEDQTAILFGELFHIYTRISNKVVGLLLRARKYKLVEFEGETLFQGQNDNTPIYLIRPLQEIKLVFKTGADPKNFEWGQLASNQQEEKKLPEKSPKKIKIKKKKSVAVTENGEKHDNSGNSENKEAKKSEITCDNKENDDSNSIAADKSVSPNDNQNDSPPGKATVNESITNSFIEVTKSNDSVSDDLNEIEVTETTISVTYLSLIESDASEKES